MFGKYLVVGFLQRGELLAVGFGFRDACLPTRCCLFVMLDFLAQAFLTLFGFGNVSAQRFEFLKLFPTSRNFSLQLGDARTKTLSLLAMARLECVDVDLVLLGAFQLANLRLAVVELFS